MTIEITGSAPRLSRREVTAFARTVLLAAGEEIGELSIAFVDDAAMRSLNRKFRNKNKTTDVLTFPGDDACEIVISIDQARRRARRRSCCCSKSESACRGRELFPVGCRW